MLPHPICSWLFIRPHDTAIQIISNVDRDERLSRQNLQSLWLRKKNLIFAPNPRDQSSLSPVCPLSSPICLGSILPHPSKPPYKADFSDCLVAQHWCSLCLAWGQLREWDGVAKIVEKCHPGMKYWWTERPCLLPLLAGMEWESRSRWATERKAKTYTLIHRKGARRTEQCGNATILSILSLGGIVIFSLPLGKP